MQGPSLFSAIVSNLFETGLIKNEFIGVSTVRFDEAQAEIDVDIRFFTTVICFTLHWCETGTKLDAKSDQWPVGLGC